MKLYIFTPYTKEDQDIVCYIITEEGEVLASHFCSELAYACGDLYGNRPERQKAWKERFGNIEVVSVPFGSLPPQEVLDKNKAAGEAAAKAKEVPVE